MPIFRKRAQFTLRELIAVMVICALGLGILLPRLAYHAPIDIETTCFNKLRQIGLALHNYESSKRRYPAASFDFRLDVDPCAIADRATLAEERRQLDTVGRSPFCPCSARTTIL